MGTEKYKQMHQEVRTDNFNFHEQMKISFIIRVMQATQMCITKYNCISTISGEEFGFQ